MPGCRSLERRLSHPLRSPDRCSSLTNTKPIPLCSARSRQESALDRLTAERAEAHGVLQVSLAAAPQGCLRHGQLEHAVLDKLTYSGDSWPPGPSLRVDPEGTSG